MQVSKAIEAGKLYRFLQCAIRMRRMQRSKSDNWPWESLRETEQSFDAQLEALASDLDKAQTGKVINAMQSRS